MKLSITLGAAALCITLGNACQQGPDRIEETRFLMDTVVRISVYPSDRPRSRDYRAVESAFEEMVRLETMTSRTVASSEVSRINDQTGDHWTPISDEIYTVLKTAYDISETTGGAFDVTVGIANGIWDFYSEDPVVPPVSAIRSVLQKIDYRLLEIDSGRCRLAKVGMCVDLGGLAKGYIVDCGVKKLMEAGIPAGIIDAGGDLRLFGKHPERNLWRIGIRHPRAAEGSLYGVIETEAVSIATSGDYERYFIRDGIRYHHILDPRTAMPADGCMSVTVLARDAMTADGYATAIFVLGSDQGMEKIESLSGIEGLILYGKNSIRRSMSSGLESMVQFFD